MENNANSVKLNGKTYTIYQSDPTADYVHYDTVNREQLIQQLQNRLNEI